MDITRRIPLLLLIVLFVLSACRAQATQVQPTPAITNIVEPVFTQEANRLPATDVEVPRVSIEEAKAALEAGTAAIVDVRSPPAFASRHITGAINVPLGDIELEPASVPLKKDQWIITYCA